MKETLTEEPEVDVNRRHLAYRYFVEILNMNRRESYTELFAPDFLITVPTHPDPYMGPEGMMDLVGMLHTAFPDFYIDVADMVIGPEAVVARWRGGGTHSGEPLHTVHGELQANGRSFEIDGMTWLRMRDGKIVRSTVHEDTMGLLAQLGHLPGLVPPPAPEPAAMLQTARIYFEQIMSAGKVDRIPEIMDEHVQFIIPTQPAAVVGHDALTGFVHYLRAAFPDIRFTVLDETAYANKVAVRWSVTGTHSGEFLGAPPTGNAINDFGIDIFTFHGDKIRTIHVNENDLGLMQQLGMIPK